MKFETKKDSEIYYIKQLIEGDISALKSKLERRERLLSNINFAIELGDFGE